MDFLNEDKRRRRDEREFYEKTQKDATKRKKPMKKPAKMNSRTEASPEWHYKVPAAGAIIGLGVCAPILVQFMAMKISNIRLNPEDTRPLNGFFHSYGLGPIYFVWIVAMIPVGALIWRKIKAIWMTNNAMFLGSPVDEFHNDAYVRTADHIISEFDAAPDAGLGFDGHVSSIVGHMMISNKGIKKIDMPILDPEREGQVAVDENGKPITKKMDLFDKKFGMELYKFSNVAMKDQKWYDATDYSFNEKNSKKEAKHGNERKGAFGRKAYDTLADYINGEFYPLETDTQRPAGVYFYDSRPVNTILIAITRGGKGLFCPAC